jgi:predicted nucleotidyltransferase
METSDGQEAETRPSSALHQHKSRIEALARAHGVANVRVFGSTARGLDRAGSDLDLLVDPSPETMPFDLAALQDALEELTGVRVDVRTPAEISMHIRERVLAEAQPL